MSALSASRGLGTYRPSDQKPSVVELIRGREKTLLVARRWKDADDGLQRPAVTRDMIVELMAA